MRDWRKASDYAFVAKLSPERLAWQFLRRNPDYRNEWIQILEPFIEAFKNKDRGRLQGLTGANGLDFLLQYLGADPDPRDSGFCIPSRKCREKWGIRAYHNPDQEAPDLLFGFAPLDSGPFDSNYPLVQEGVDLSRYPYLEAAVFDLRLPIKQQIEVVRQLLLWRQDRFKPVLRELEDGQTVPRLGHESLKPSQTRLPKKQAPWKGPEMPSAPARNRPQNLLPLYLQVLDALDEGATHREIADTLFVEEEGGIEGEPERAYWTCEQAREWTKPDRYLGVVGFFA